MQTVVGLYRSIGEANQVKQALLNEGYNAADVTVIDQNDGGYGEGGYGSGTYGSGTTAGSGTFGSGTTAGSGVTGATGSNTAITDTRTSEYGGTGTTRDTADTGVGTKIKHFFQGLAGHDEHTHTAYTEGVSRGGALVAVKVNDGEADRAAGILRSHGATDIEGDEGGSGIRASRTGETGGTTSEQVIPVVQEELVVGKRQVERGGVRVYSHVVSQPVSESVSLHDERVVVDRRPVDRAATEADFADAGPIEVRARGEEAIVGKTGRVVEEVVVGKTATDRTETIEDSVRRTEVDVESVGTDNTTTNTRNTGSKF